MEASLPLPELTADEAAHAARVLAHLVAGLEASGGRWPFAAFMAEALYAPGLGYYAAGARKFGASGDFITAPEVSPLFGDCLARQVAEVFGNLRADPGAPLTLVEYGAGSGALAVQLLQSLAALGELPDTYAIVEVSAELRERQAEAVATLPPALASRVCWWPGHASAPWRGVLLANEVLDALPVERLRIGVEGIEQRFVVAREANLALDWQPAVPALQVWFAEVGKGLPLSLSLSLPAGTELEACLAAGPWVQDALAHLVAGVALYIDYGLPRAQLYSPARPRGTFSAFCRHRQHEDALWHPGLQDLTAWVDFTGVAEAGLAAGAHVAGFTTQAQFLVNAGLDAAYAARLAGLEAEERDEQNSARRALRLAALAQGAQRLVMPQEMGERFKVLSLAKGYDEPLVGFARRDLTDTL
jgi:SAM-dependent MidA family methyltransferase